MQFRTIPALLVFLGSYFPLAIILALQDVSPETWNAPICSDISFKSCSTPQLEHPILSLTMIFLSGACLALTFLILDRIRYRYPIDVIESKSIPNELISYSFPYIVSFMGVDYGSSGKIAGLVAFLLWLFLITYRAGQIIMNPILLIFGWNLYEAKIRIQKQERIVKILSKAAPTPGTYECEEVQGSYIAKQRDLE